MASKPSPDVLSSAPAPPPGSLESGQVSSSAVTLIMEIGGKGSKTADLPILKNVNLLSTPGSTTVPISSSPKRLNVAVRREGGRAVDEDKIVIATVASTRGTEYSVPSEEDRGVSTKIKKGANLGNRGLFFASTA